MSEHDFENKVQTLNVELMSGQTNQAASMLRDELYRNPQEAMALINYARQPGTADEIVFGANGSVAIRDHMRGYDQQVGQLPGQQPQIAPPCEQPQLAPPYGPQQIAPPCEQTQFVPQWGQPQYEQQWGQPIYRPEPPCGPAPWAPRVPCEPIVHPRGAAYDWGLPHREIVDVRLGGGTHIDLGAGDHRHHR